MDAPAEYNGDQCMVLPADYLRSVDAAAELYDDEIAQVVTNLEVRSLERSRGFFRGTLLAALLWGLPATWMPCL